MPCPKCESTNLTVSYESYEDDMHYEEYECDDCGCIFTWVSKREIVEEPKEEEDDPLVKLRKKKKAIEEWYAQHEEDEEEEDDGL